MKDIGNINVITTPRCRFQQAGVSSHPAGKDRALYTLTDCMAHTRTSNSYRLRESQIGNIWRPSSCPVCSRATQGPVFCMNATKEERNFNPQAFFGGLLQKQTYTCGSISPPRWLSQRKRLGGRNNKRYLAITPHLVMPPMNACCTAPKSQHIRYFIDTLSPFLISSAFAYEDRDTVSSEGISRITGKILSRGYGTTAHEKRNYRRPKRREQTFLGLADPPTRSKANCK